MPTIRDLQEIIFPHGRPEQQPVLAAAGAEQAAQDPLQEALIAIEKEHFVTWNHRSQPHRGRGKPYGRGRGWGRGWSRGRGRNKGGAKQQDSAPGSTANIGRGLASSAEELGVPPNVLTPCQLAGIQDTQLLPADISRLQDALTANWQLVKDDPTKEYTRNHEKPETRCYWHVARLVAQQQHQPVVAHQHGFNDADYLGEDSESELSPEQIEQIFADRDMSQAAALSTQAVVCQGQVNNSQLYHYLMPGLQHYNHKNSSYPQLSLNEVPPSHFFIACRKRTKGVVYFPVDYAEVMEGYQSSGCFRETCFSTALTLDEIDLLINNYSGIEHILYEKTVIQLSGSHGISDETISMLEMATDVFLIADKDMGAHVEFYHQTLKPYLEALGEAEKALLDQQQVSENGDAITIKDIFDLYTGEKRPTSPDQETCVTTVCGALLRDFCAKHRQAQHLADKFPHIREIFPVPAAAASRCSPLAS